MTSFAELSKIARHIWQQYGPAEGEKITDRHLIDIDAARDRALEKVGAHPNAARWFTVEFDRPIGTTQSATDAPERPFHAPSVRASCWEDALLMWAMWPQAHDANVVDVRRLVFDFEPVIWEDIFDEAGRS